MRHILSILLALSIAIPSLGQGYSYGIDPGRDSLAVKQIRMKMDSIRRHRPTVGLVLSGGGAKGAAEIGAMRYLEELHIPVDLVTGTSIGGLVGGFYSVGYTSTQIDTIIRNIDWGVALTDRVPRNYVSYKTYRYNQKYLVSIPFYYPKDVYLSDLESQKQMDTGRQKPESNLSLGAGSKGDSTFVVLKNNILASLPSGAVYGQNVGNLFSSYTVGYQDERNFWDFPRTFACVATELVSSKAKVWYGGKLNLALRSTMSIPGLFTPVKTNGMVLVDGGMRNNYPVDLAREMGADYVIGIDLSDGYMDYSEINNLVDILVQGTNMLGRDAYERNAGTPDVTIQPYLKEYNMLSFDSASVDTMLRRGYDAALQVKDSLLALRDKVNPDSSALPVLPHATDLSRHKVLVSGTEFSGVTAAERENLSRLIDIEPGEYLGKAEIEDAVATIYGTKAFDYVTYELLGTGEPYVLHFDCKKGPVHQLGFGIRADTDEIVSLLLNAGFNVHSIQGNAFEFTAKIGANPYAQAHYYFMTAHGPAINLSSSIKYVDNNSLGIKGDSKEVEVRYFNNREEVWVSNLRWHHNDIGIGTRGDYYSIRSLFSDTPFSDNPVSGGSGYDLKEKDMYFSAFLRSRTETFDDAYFPTKGLRFGLDYSWVFGAANHKVDPFHTLQADFKTIAPIGRHFALLPSLAGRAILGGGDIPLPYVNLIGGRMAGRYLDQQIPFMGVTYAVGMPKVVLLAGLDARFRISTNNYVIATAGFGTSDNKLEDIFALESNFFSGFGLEYAYDSILGPIRADLHWSSLTHKVGFYVSLGFDF